MLSLCWITCYFWLSAACLDLLQLPFTDKLFHLQYQFLPVSFRLLIKLSLTFAVTHLIVYSEVYIMRGIQLKQFLFSPQYFSYYTAKPYVVCTQKESSHWDDSFEYPQHRVRWSNKDFRTWKTPLTRVLNYYHSTDHWEGLYWAP